jgi:hypothetical protein
LISNDGAKGVVLIKVSASARSEHADFQELISMVALEAELSLAVQIIR